MKKAEKAGAKGAHDRPPNEARGEKRRAALSSGQWRAGGLAGGACAVLSPEQHKMNILLQFAGRVPANYTKY